MSTRIFRIPVASGWFDAQQDKTWTTPASNTISSVYPMGADLTAAYGLMGPSEVCTAWTGACVDQSTGEYIFPAQGGHDTYYGNEIYVLNLRAAAPAWSRIWGPQVVWSGATGGASNTKAGYGNNTPQSHHGYLRPVAGGNGIWLPGIDGISGGYQSSAVWRFNRTTQAWSYFGLGRASINTSQWEGGIGVYDSVLGRVIGTHGADVGCFMCTDAGVITEFNVPYAIRVNSNGGFGSIIGRAWVVWGTQGDVPYMYAMDLDNPTAGWTRNNISGTAPTVAHGHGCYHAASSAFLFWNNSGATIYKLSVPANPFSGTYTWQGAISPNPSNANIPGNASNGVYGKFNIVNDMGNGRSALVLTTSTTSPTYVYKLPLAGV